MIKDINKFKIGFMELYDKGDDLTQKETVKLSNMKKKYIKRFKGLKMSDQAHMLLIENTAKFMSYTNGVGSEVNWWGRFSRWLIPRWLRNKLFGVDITPASDLHDVEYSIKIKFKTISEGESFKENGDRYFKENMGILIKKDKKINSLDSLRFVKARLYFMAVGYCGSESFWTGKVKPKV